MSRMNPRMRLEKVAAPMTPAALMTWLRSARAAVEDSASEAMLPRAPARRLPCGEAFKDPGGEQRHHDFVVADQAVALAAPLRRPPDHVRERAIVRHEIHIHGRDAIHGMTEV